MRWGRKFSLRMLLLAVAVVAAGLAVVRWNDPAVRYRRTSEAEAFHAVMRDRIRNGATLGEVSRLLGPGSLVTDPEFHAEAVSYALRNPNPQGARDTDAFYTWETTGWNFVLHFRDGRLINHNPSTYPVDDPSVLNR